MKKLLPLVALVAFFYLPVASAHKGNAVDLTAGADALKIAPLHSAQVTTDFDGR